MFQQSTSSVVCIDEIDPICNRYEIRVKILKIWRGFKKDTGSSMEMVLVDEKGTRIHATVDEKHVSKHRDFLKEDLSVSIDTFQLTNNGLEYKTAPQSFKIGFFRTTVVEPYNDFPKDIPEKYFVEFSKILCGDMDPKMLIDVIGRISSVGPVEDLTVKGRLITKMDVELQDLTGMRLMCTFWGNYAAQVKAYTETKQSTSIVCVVRLAQVKEFRGNWSISNAFSSTKILLDPNTQFANEFRSKLIIDENVQILTPNKTKGAAADSVSLHDEFFVLNAKKNLLEIVTSEEALTCVTVARVGAIVDPFRWCYLTCKECDKKVQPYPEKKDYSGPPSYDCEKCDKVVTNVTARYRLMLSVSDGMATTKFLLFDIIAQNLLNKSADEMLLEIPQDKPRMLPPTLARLVGKDMLFKIKIGADNKQTAYTHYVVQKFWDHPKMVEAFVAGRLPEVVAEASTMVVHDVVDEVVSDSSTISTIISASRKNKLSNRTNVDDNIKKYDAKKKIKTETDTKK